MKGLARGLGVREQSVVESMVINHMAEFHADIRVFKNRPRLLPEFVKHGDGTPYEGEELFDTLVKIHEREIKRAAGMLRPVDQDDDIEDFDIEDYDDEGFDDE